MISFFATMKLVTSEEVLSEVVSQADSPNDDYIVLFNPIIIAENNQIDTEKGIVVSGLVPRKWMIYGNQTETIVFKNHIVSISEMDKFGVDFYKKALIAAKCSSPIKRKVDTEKHSGYIGKIESFRKLIDKTYKDSPDLTKE